MGRCSGTHAGMARIAAYACSVPRKFYIRTFGCQMNEHDSERMAGLLVAEGMEPTEDLQDADVVLLNTCCIRENADNKLYGHLGHLKPLTERKPGMQIAVGGCLAQMDGEALLRRAPYVDVVFGTHNVSHLPELLNRAAQEGPVLEVLDAPGSNEDPTAGAMVDDVLSLGAVREVPYAAWVTIQAGCDNSCAFCIVPSVRGPEKSRSPEAIEHEVRRLASQGVTEITLLGQNVNSYGRDITRRGPLFAGLLRSLGAIEGISRIRFTSPHPKDLRTDTIEAMATTPAVCEQLHLPMQSGSDRVLASMRRGYTAERYLDRLRAARLAIGDLAVTTDLIVGFPGETDADFDRTLEVVAEAQFDSAFTFVFSPRPGTRAAAMAESFVDPEVVGDRFERLQAVLMRSGLAKHRARIGLVEEVLVEGPSKRDTHMMTGRSRQGKLVHFPIPTDARGSKAGPDCAGAITAGESPRPGSYVAVRITDAAPHHLMGEMVALVAASRHRARIPVVACTA